MAKKKMENSFLNMVMVLTGVALISSLALGFTYSITKPVKDKVDEQKKVKAIKAVLPEFDKLGVMQQVEDLELYPALKDGNPVGTAVKSVSFKGFSGKVWIMVGFDTKGTIVNTSVLKHTETPGLGTKMSTPKFKTQYNGKNPSSFNLDVKKDGGDVDAITAATISSRAFSDAVQKAYDALKSKGGIK